MTNTQVRVVLHAKRIDKDNVYTDESFAHALRADGIDLAVEIPEPEPLEAETYHADSVVEFLVEHVRVYLPLVGAGAAAWLAGKVGDEAWNLLKGRIKKVFVRSSKEQIATRRDFNHHRTVTIYDAQGRPLSEVTVRGHADEEPHVSDSDL